MPLDLTACLARLHRPRAERRPAPRGRGGACAVWGGGSRVDKGKTAGCGRGRPGAAACTGRRPCEPRGRAAGAEFLIPDSAAAQGTTKWKECAAEYTVALGRGAAGSCRATVPAPVARELGLPARITFRRSGNRFTVEPGGAKAAGGPAAGGSAAQSAGGGGGRGAGPRRLEDGPPSEMSLETNILRYLANCLERRHGLAEGAVVPVSPTQHEEHALGFDAMVGLPRGRYAVLQFKRPEKADHGGARFKMDDRQALTLLRYPRGSAFYVLPPVRTNGEMAGLGRCLLHRARIVDAWDVLAATLRSQRAARPAAACNYGGNGDGAGSGRDHIARVDGGGRGAVHIRAGGGGGRQPYFEVHSKPASSLCRGAGGIGFDVRDGRMATRRGAKWDRGEWRAEARRVLGAPIGRACSWINGRLEADEPDAPIADDDRGRRGVDKAESRFRRALDHDGQDGDGDGAYLLWIASAP